ncbi:MAG TPA: GntR family transcriptional regulator [Longimicrobiaceae bacterium]|nr:GntR family transcriptional regulator [Longimicrobiaceae bacterium]
MNPPSAGARLRGQPANEEAAQRERRGDHAYEKLREMIVWGRLAPGSLVVEVELAERLGVSRTPVRGALQRLRQEGYIGTSGVGRQARLVVSRLTVEDAFELFEIVGQIEGLAARRAARRDAADRARIVKDMRKLNTELLRSFEGPRRDTNLLFRLDYDFHRIYVEASSGARLLALHDAIKPQAERYNRIYTSVLVSEIQTSVVEHEEIAVGIEEGDPDRAELAARTNFSNAAERLSSVILTLGERGTW